MEKVILDDVPSPQLLQVTVAFVFFIEAVMRSSDLRPLPLALLTLLAIVSGYSLLMTISSAPSTICKTLPFSPMCSGLLQLRIRVALAMHVNTTLCSSKAVLLSSVLVNATLPSASAAELRKIEKPTKHMYSSPLNSNNYYL